MNKTYQKPHCVIIEIQNEAMICESISISGQSAKQSSGMEVRSRGSRSHVFDEE